VAKHRFLILAGDYTEHPRPDKEGNMPVDKDGNPVQPVTYSFKKNNPPVYVESAFELDRMFVNKFQRVDAQGHPVHVEGVARPVIPPEPGMGFEFSPGVPTPAAVEAASVDPVEASTRAATGNQAGTAPGEDVTEDFDGATDKGLKVMKANRMYYVVPADAMNKPIKDGAELTNKTQVKDAIHGYKPPKEE
jgi:hypothetical protein